MFGVGTGPPKVLDMLKPTSSAIIRKTLGAPSGACTGAERLGVESPMVSRMTPVNGGGSIGRSSRGASANTEGELANVTTAVADRKAFLNIPLPLLCAPG